MGTNVVFDTGYLKNLELNLVGFASVATSFQL